MIQIELSKAYLYRALRCKDSDSDSIYCLANVCLAVLYYTTGLYRTAIDHCTLATRTQDHSQCSSHVVRGEILPKISDDVDNALGLAVFYQHVRTAVLNQQQQTEYVSVYPVFTADLLAHYLLFASPSGTNNVKLSQRISATERQWYVKCIRNAQRLFVADVLLFMCVNHLSEQKLSYVQLGINIVNCQRITSIISNTVLIELLEKSAIAHLTTFRQLKARDFGSVTRIVTTDFEALYAYKHGDYQRCLQLSAQNVRTLLNGDSLGV